MPTNLKKCGETALKLPAAARAALAEQLIASLDHLDEAEHEQLWVEEAARRYRDYRKGRIAARPAADAIRDARARI